MANDNAESMTMINGRPGRPACITLYLSIVQRVFLVADFASRGLKLASHMGRKDALEKGLEGAAWKKVILRIKVNFLGSTRTCWSVES